MALKYDNLDITKTIYQLPVSVQTTSKAAHNKGGAA